MMEEKTNFGDFIGETIALLRDGGVYVLLFVVTVGGLGFVGQMGGAIDPDRWIGLGIRFDGDHSTAWGILAALASIAASIAGGYLLLARMLELRGRLAPGGTRIWAYLGLSILIGVGTMLGFVALIVPGIILMVRWSAAPGFLVGQRLGVTNAMEKSWHATKPHAWPIFFVMLVGLVGLVLFSAAVGAASTSFSDNHPAFIAAEEILGAFGSVLSLTFGAAVFVLVSHDEREMENVFA